MNDYLEPISVYNIVIRRSAFILAQSASGNYDQKNGGLQVFNPYLYNHSPYQRSKKFTISFEMDNPYSFYTEKIPLEGTFIYLGKFQLGSDVVREFRRTGELIIDPR